MATLGHTNQLVVNRFVDFGAFLEGGELGEILLPKRYLPEGTRAGDTLEVFVYRDSEDRIIATTEKPFAEVGGCGYLKVAQVNKTGAFLEWGLEKDLFVPFGEQRRPMEVGKRYVVVLYIDNTKRIAATSKLRKFLPFTSRDYKAGDEVRLLITGRTDLGYEAAIDDKVLGMVFESDALTPLKPGMRLTGYIKGIRPDGKIDLMLQSPESRGDLPTQILEHLKRSGGTSSITDKSAPKDIFAAFGVSKRAFKQALGGLYKERRVVLKDGLIELADRS